MAGKGARYFMVRRRRDANQKAITDAFEAVGVPYWDLSGVGGGCPDLVARHRQNRRHDVFLEVKTEDGELNPAQISAREIWGTVVVQTVDEALRAVGIDAVIVPRAKGK